MKKNVLAILLLALPFTLFLSSCKKKSNSLLVEYRIAPINNSITKITFNDNMGNPIIVTDYAKFGTGSTFVAISALPYTAKVSIDVNNQTVGSLVYDLAILVNGNVMQLASGVALPMTASTIISAEYIVN